MIEDTSIGVLARFKCENPEQMETIRDFVRNNFDMKTVDPMAGFESKDHQTPEDKEEEVDKRPAIEIDSSPGMNILKAFENISTGEVVIGTEWLYGVRGHHAGQYHYAPKSKIDALPNKMQVGLREIIVGEEWYEQKGFRVVYKR